MAETKNGPGIPAKVPALAHPLAEDPTEIASNINYHAQFTPHFSPFKFQPEQAYYATAESVRDRLIQVTFQLSTFFFFFTFHIIKNTALSLLQSNVHC